MAIQVNNRKLRFVLVEGTAFGVKHSTETAYENKYSVLANSSYTASYEKQETSFWLKDEHGREYSVSFRAPLTLRDGHRVRVVYGQWEHENVMYPVALQNVTMDMLHQLELVDVLARFSISLRTDSGCAGAAMTLFTLFVAPVVGAINAGSRGAILGFFLSLCVFVPWGVSLSFQARRKHREFGDGLSKEIAQILSALPQSRGS
jgi:hypothetical protein